jgi:hypothetical protein
VSKTAALASKVAAAVGVAHQAKSIMFDFVLKSGSTSQLERYGATSLSLSGVKGTALTNDVVLVLYFRDIGQDFPANEHFFGLVNVSARL